MTDTPPLAGHAGDTLINRNYWQSYYWRDFWMYRHLIPILTYSMLKARYHQTVVGIGWAIIKPILFTLVMTFAFNRVAKIEPQSDHVSYLALVFSAIIPWHIV